MLEHECGRLVSKERLDTWSGKNSIGFSVASSDALVVEQVGLTTRVALEYEEYRADLLGNEHHMIGD